MIPTHETEQIEPPLAAVSQRWDWRNRKRCNSHI